MVDKEINDEFMKIDTATMKLYVDCGKVNATHVGEHLVKLNIIDSIGLKSIYTLKVIIKKLQVGIVQNYI